MKKTLLCCVLCLLHTPDLSAEESASRAVQIKIGAEIYHERYKEYIDEKLFMREDAAMFGIYTQAHLPFHRLHAIDLLARLAVGSSRYTGAIQQEAYGSLIAANQDRYVWEARALYTLNLPFTYGWSPLLGAGYRKLTDRLDQAGEGGYKRTSEYIYATSGLTGDFDLGGQWHFAPQLLYHHLLRGKQKSTEGSWMLIHPQHHGHGAELTAAFNRSISAHETISIAPYIKYWHIADSDIVSQNGIRSNEPKNKTKEMGLTFSYLF